MEKKQFRQKAKALRKCSRDKDKIRKSVLEKFEGIKGKCVSVFVSFGDEIDTHPLIEMFLSNGCRVGVPKIMGNGEMLMKEIASLNDLEPQGKYGIEEPDNDAKTIDGDEFDLILVPGLAFDSGKHRIGYGGGYYDRYLSLHKIHSIGLGYNEQLCESLPYDERDVPLDEIALF